MSIQEEIEQIKTQLNQTRDEYDESELLITLLKKLSGLNSNDTKPYTERLLHLAQKLNSVRCKAWGLFSQANHNRLKGLNEVFFSGIQEAIVAFQQLPDMEGLGLSYNMAGIYYQNQGNKTEALKNHLLALKVGQETTNNQVIAIAYSNIGLVHISQNNYGEAMEALLAAAEIAQQTGDTGVLAYAYNNIAMIFQNQGKYHESMKYNLLALEIRELIGNKQGVAQSLNNLGLNHYNLGNYPEALKCNLKSLQIREELGSKIGAAVSLSNIGLIYNRQLNHTEALKKFLVALEICKELDYREGMAGALSNIGVVHELQADYPKAMNHHTQALQIREQIGDRGGMATSYFNIGTLNSRQGNYTEAVKNFSQSLKTKEELGEKPGIGNCYNALADIYEKQGNHSEAIKTSLVALGIGHELENKTIIKESARILYSNYKATRDFKSALIYYEQYVQVEKETLGEEAQKQLTNLSFQHNLEQKEKEAEINRLRYVELESKNQQIQQEKEEADRQRKRAEQSEHFKQMFLANMSHEIRTPMNAIAGMTNILLSSNQSKENLQYLNAIKHSSDNLLVVINDVLDISKMEAGKLNIERTAFNVEQQLYALRNIFNLKAAEKKISFVIDVARDVPEGLVGDPHRLNQVLINLLGNAFKFTHKGKVTLSITKISKNKYRFGVKDSGIGIAPEKLALIFESFSQAESDTTRQYGGTGLGLTISKQLVELMGGQIKVTSKPGKGSEFAFELALNTAKKTDVPVSSKTKLLSIVKDLKGLRILLAEDNRYNQIVSVEIIKKFMNGPEIAIAETGKEVLQKLKVKDYDIILMDLHMPVMDGYEATKKIRTTFTESKKHIPILAVTASVVQADIDRCFAVGMNGYVSKPFSPEQLLEEIRKLKSGNAESTVKISKGAKAKVATKNKKELQGVDTSYLENITEGNKTEMVEYIDIFMEFAPVQMQKMEEACKSSDNKALYSALHTIKPQLQFMGVQNALARTLKLEIEVRATEKVSSKMKEEAAVIDSEIKSAMKQWSTIKEKLNSK